MQKKLASILIVFSLLFIAVGSQECLSRGKSPAAKEEKNRTLASSPPFFEKGIVHILTSILLLSIWFLIYKLSKKKDKKRRRSGL